MQININLLTQSRQTVWTHWLGVGLGITSLPVRTL